MSGFQAPITIKQAIDRIENNHFLLPAFQREFVWSSEQIEKLFDSLMKDYPISSMLFWKVNGKTKTDFKFYKFLKIFREWYKIHNEPIQTDSLNDFHAVLDGQQRLTALYIGLCGSYAYKEYRKKWQNTEWSLPTRVLYLDINQTVDDENNLNFNFRFLKNADTDENDIYRPNENEKWFRVGRILSLHKDEYDLDDFIDDNNLTKEQKKIIRKLDKVIHNKNIINFYEEDEQIPDKVVNVFIRINSGGTYLSFSDILMSVAVANWKEKDARTEIHQLVDNIRALGFSIDKDYILKAFLFLYHKDVKYKITSFNNNFIKQIEINWDNIRDAILKLFELIKKFGLNDYTLTTKNATLPMLYYIYHEDIYKNIVDKINYKQERKLLQEWIYSILVRRIFAGQGDAVLTQSRKAFTNNVEEIKIQKKFDNFPKKEINSVIKKMTEVSDEYLEELLYTQKDTKFAFSILALLYPNLDYSNTNFHQDHLHPVTNYDNLSEENKETFGWEAYNSILNLQMLDANENMSKQDKSLQDWVNSETTKENKTDFFKTHLIPDVSLKLDNFEQFISERKKILIKRLKEILNR